jgi:tetratricopeptide (TPR) repeat protein
VTLAVALGLAIITVAVYWPVRHYGWLCFDDGFYVFENPHVRTGLTPSSLIWAWTQPAAGTWQQPLAFYMPLTVMSYLLDSQLFGLDPGAYHLTNVVLHVTNTLLLFAVLWQMTAHLWRSAWVAGLFALHPLHIESVAWIAGRKDMVSTSFWMLAMLAYVGYVRRPSVRRYALLVVAYIAALLSKGPAVVTLPFALLLLDFWPLRRLRFGRFCPEQPSGDASSAMPGPAPTVVRALAEKLPLLTLAAIATAVGATIQARAMVPLMFHAPPSLVTDRIANALVSYATYVRQMFWPTNLAALYPFRTLSAAEVVTATALLLGISVCALWGMRRYPYLLVGWLWYLGILVPSVGLVRTLNLGVRADRYTYLSAVGIFIILAWGIPDLLARWRHRQRACGAAAVAALAACTVLTMQQLPKWRSSLTLFQHALTVTDDNLIAQDVVGHELFQQGQVDAALEHFLAVTQIAERRRRIAPPYWERTGPINPYYDFAEANAGQILLKRGDIEAAKQLYLRALAVDPSYGGAHYRLGSILASQGDASGALQHYRATVQREPSLAVAHNNLAITLERLGQIDEALSEYAEGLRLEPGNVQSRTNFAAALAAAGRLPEAIEQFRIVLQLQPQLAEARVGLAAAYAQAGQRRAAVVELDALLRDRPEWPAGEAALAWLLATADEADLRDGARALQLAEAADRQTAHGNPEVLKALAAAYAEAGRFPEAVATAERLLALAGDGELPAPLRSVPAHLAAYRAGQPVRVPSP